MTEDEAKTKWCPFARTGLHSGNGGVAVNRSVAGDMRDTPFSVYDETRCLGSGCMAWRQTSDGIERRFMSQKMVAPLIARGEAWVLVEGAPAGANGFRTYERKKGPPHGVCGLAEKEFSE